MKKRRADRICTALGVVSIIFLMWIFVSVIDTNVHNADLNPQYSAWNFFEITGARR